MTKLTNDQLELLSNHALYNISPELSAWVDLAARRIIDEETDAENANVHEQLTACYDRAESYAAGYSPEIATVLNTIEIPDIDANRINFLYALLVTRINMLVCLFFADLNA